MRLWHHEAADEADGVEKCDEKSEIGDQSVEKRDEFQDSIS